MDDRDELSRRLWLLREQMLQLLCALEIQQLVLSHNKLRWLPMVSENVESVLDDIRITEAERITVSRRVCRLLGIADDASLAELVQAADEPHASLWRQCRHQLTALQAEIDEVSQENRQLTRRGLSATESVLHGLSGETNDSYDPAGATTSLAPAASRFDRTV